jgi:hypothetical protein
VLGKERRLQAGLITRDRLFMCNADFPVKIISFQIVISSSRSARPD